jgi:signal transduction histidine kinase
VTFESDLAARRLRDNVETNLFRIPQEALTNVARHAQATSVSINLISHGGQVILTVRDNGRGIQPAERQAGRGLGLAGMQTRARGCGGRLRMESVAGQGLTIEVTCPIGQ